MSDAELIKNLGGSTKVARLLGLGPGGVQRVNNWRIRGIPDAIKLKYAPIFLSAYLAGKDAAASSAEV